MAVAHKGVRCYPSPPTLLQDLSYLVVAALSLTAVYTRSDELNQFRRMLQIYVREEE